MNKIIATLQNHPLIIIIMFAISLLGGIIGITLGWNDFYKDVLSKDISMPIWLLLLLIFISLVIYIWRPQKKSPPKSADEFTLVEGESFGVQQVILDGKKFINCEFNGTELLFKGVSGFEMGHNNLTGIRFTLTDYSAQTLVVLSGMRKDPAFAPIVDGYLNDIKAGKLPESPPVNKKHA